MLDMLAPKYELNFKGENGYKTPLGSVFTLVVFGITFFSIRNTFSDFINKTNPQMTLENYTVDELSTTSTSSIPIQITFEIAGGDRSKVSTSGILAPNVTYSKSSEPSKNDKENQGEGKDNMKKDQKSGVRMINCLFSNSTSDSSSFCLDSTQTLNFGDTEFKFDPSESTEYVNYTFVMHIEYKDLKYNLSNYDNPFFEGSGKEFVLVQSNYFSLRELLFVKKTVRIRDTGFIYYNERTPVDYYQLDQIKLIYSFDQIMGQDDNKGPTGHNFKFTIKTTGENIEIDYVTFDDVLSAFGGTFGSIFYIVQTVYAYICDFFMNVELVNVVFKFHSGSDIIHRADNFESKFRNTSELQCRETEMINNTNLVGSYNIREISKRKAPEIITDNIFEQRMRFENNFEEFHAKKDKLATSNLTNVELIDLGREEESPCRLQPDIQIRNDLRFHMNSLVKLAETANQGRIAYAFGCCQYFRAKWKKQIGLKSLNLEEKILLTAESILEFKMSYEYLAKSLNEINSVKNLILDESLLPLIDVPSLNVRSATSINWLNNFLELSCNNSQQEFSSFRKIIGVFSESRLWRKEKVKKLFKNFSVSLF